MIGVGQRVGDYEVVSRLRPGGMATLFLARRVGPQGFRRPVVIKTVHPSLADDADAAKMFLDEARVSASIHHPNVVHVEELGEAAGTYFLAMEYIPGEAVSTLLAALGRAGRSLEPRFAGWIARCAAAGLHAAHETRDAEGVSLDIIHRDVSPQNLLVSIDGHVKVIDFGIAKSTAGRSETQTGALKGKLAYISPEQARAERVDRRTDVYALGIVLWEMLTMERLFGGSHAALFDRLESPEVRPPSAVGPHVAAVFDEVVLRALAPDPADRFQTAGEMERAIAQLAPEGPDVVADLARAVRELLGDKIEARRRSAFAEVTLDRTVPMPPLRLPEVDEPATILTPSGVTPGSTTATRRRQREAERRQVTVWVCELDVGALAETLDPEDLYDLLHEYQTLCAAVVGRFGGELVQTVRGRVLGCFGYPVAHEDAALRAVRAALAMGEAVAPLRRSAPGATLSPRAAVHTGLVIAGDLTGSGAQAAGPVSIVGEARDVAVELLASAEPGAVVISGRTRRLAEGAIECEARGPQALESARRPIDVYRVLGEREAQSRIEVARAGAGGLTPLVGRDREVGLLRDRWEQVKDHQGQVAMLVGEAGIGKSRLTFVLREHVERERAAGQERLIVEWRGSPQHQNSSLHPASEYLERTLRFRRDEPDEAKVERLAEWLSHGKLQGAEALSLFASLVSLETPGRVTGPQLTPDKLKQETLDALVEWVRRAADAAPVLFVVEDLHWIDASTLDVIRTLIEEARSAPLFLVLTYRPEFKPPWHDPRLTQVPLQRLSHRQIGEMLAQRTSAKALPPEVAEQVAARSDGVPLFIEECTNMLLETGLLHEEADAYVLTGPLPRDAIPATLADLLMARLDRLGDAKEVAQLGAILGREFTHELLEAASTLEPAALDAELAALLDAEVLFRKGRPPAHRYQFKHALIQDAAYNSLLKKTRQQHHRRVAEVLEARFAETARATPEVLAQHFTEAGLAERAVPYWEKAGLLCRDRSANPEAISHFTRALELLATLEPSSERDAQELRLQLPLGIAYLSAKGYAAPEGGPVFARARDLAERIGEKPQIFAVVWGAWAWHVVRGDFRLCMELSAEAMRLADELDDPGIRMEALFLPGLTLLYRGDFVGSHAQTLNAITSFDDRARCAVWAAHTGQNSGSTHRSYHALALWQLGSPYQALAMAREAIARAREAEHPYTVCYVLHHAAWLYYQCRLGAEAEAAAEEEIAIAAEHAFALWGVTGRLYRAAAWLLQGRADEALPALTEGIAAYKASGAGLALPFYLSMLADAQRQTGQLREAFGTIADALRVAEVNDDLIQTAELNRQQGELLLALWPERVSEAESCFQTARTIARRQRSRAWELRATMSLARLWQQHGQVDRARAALAEVYSAFTEGWSAPDLVDARRLLDELGSAGQ